jgi:uncharacterized membrane protein
MQTHFRHHARFYVAALLGLSVGIALWMRGSDVALVAAGDVFFAAYLGSTWFVAARATPKGLRKYAGDDDEGVGLIFVLTFAAIAVSLTAILLLLRQSESRDAPHIAITIASVPLGWLMLHTLMAFRYAHLYYAPTDGRDARGLDFHAKEEPAGWDFLYHAFVIGMTGGVSDIEVQSVAMRRLATVHGIVSFFYNTVILALTVSVVASKGG